MTWCEGSAERRSQQRQLSSHDSVGVSVRPGQAVTMIDQSAGGVLVESDRPLRPGAIVDIQIVAGAQRIVARGRVLRCSVSQLRVSRVWYRGAISFDKPLAWLATGNDQGYPLPTAVGASAVARAEAAHGAGSAASADR